MMRKIQYAAKKPTNIKKHQLGVKMVSVNYLYQPLLFIQLSTGITRTRRKKNLRLQLKSRDPIGASALEQSLYAKLDNIKHQQNYLSENFHSNDWYVKSLGILR